MRVFGQVSCCSYVCLFIIVFLLFVYIYLFHLMRFMWLIREKSLIYFFKVIFYWPKRSLNGNLFSSYCVRCCLLTFSMSSKVNVFHFTQSSSILENSIGLKEYTMPNETEIVEFCKDTNQKVKDPLKFIYERTICTLMILTKK